MGTPKASGAKSWPTRLLFGLLWILGSAALCGGIVYAGLAVTDQLGEYSGSSVVVDLDSDGDLDVVTVNIRRESELTSFAGATLWFNQGGKKFTPVNPELGGIAAAAGDVDRDGDADLFVLPTFEMVLVLNQGGAQGGRTGTFKVNNPIYPAGLSATYGSIVLGDLNGDGQVDGFVAGCCGMSYPGPSGQTTYTPPVSFVWINDWDPRGWLVRHAAVVPELENLPVPAAALGDLNGDGSLDVYAAVQPPKTGGESGVGEWVLFNDGRGSFRDSGQRLGAGNSSSVALGDLDGDGDLDALVGMPRGAAVRLNLGGAQGRPAGVFGAYQPELSGSQTQAVFLADLDGDGDLDALVAGKKQAAIWWNDGKGNFSPSKLRFNYSDRQALAVGDFNGDGRPDIFAGGSSYFGAAAVVWLNQGSGVFR